MDRLRVDIIHADVLDGLKQLKPQSVQCVVTSPPYYQMRFYPGIPEQDAAFGEEREAICQQLQNGGEGCGLCYVCRTVRVFDLLYDVMHDTGIVWWNVGDKYSECGSPMLIPFWIGVVLQRRGWLLRDIVIWAKQIYEERIQNTVGRCVPETLHGWAWGEKGALRKSAWRTTKSWEPVLMFVKKGNRYFADRKNIEMQSYYSGAWSNNIAHPAYVRFRGRELNKSVKPPKNLPAVWRISPGGSAVGRKANYSDNGEGHVAMMPLELAELCVRASTTKWGCCAECGYPALDGKHTCEHKEANLQPMLVLDPFCGSGTTGIAALKNGCSFVGIDKSETYVKLARKRISQAAHQMSLL